MGNDKKTGTIGIIITIIILITLVITTNIDVNKFSKAENIFNKLVMPVQNGLTYLKNKIAKNNSFFESIDELKKENEELKEKNEKLETAMRELEIIKAENSTLREYANMTDKYTQYETVPAYIINKDVSNLSSTMIINVGTENGITENMPVISSEGLVGYTISATKNTTKVKPIIDSSSSVSGVMKISRDNVIIKGMLDSNNKLKITYIPTEADLVIGETIETSGLGGIYPKGILVGTLKEIIETKNITDRYAIMETAVDFSKLETVLVIKGGGVIE